jgi:SulP family sulfate permease
MRVESKPPNRPSAAPTLATRVALGPLTRSLSAGVLLYFLDIIVVVSFAALIFSGRLAGLLPEGVGLLLAGNVILVGAIALFSSYEGSIAVAQDTSAVMLAVIAASIVTQLPAGAGPAQQLATVVLAIVATSLATGLFFLLLGVFKVGSLVRFLPYPVMGGFLAGTGWLLVAGGLGVMTTTALTAGMFQPAQLLLWIPGAVLGVLLLLASTRFAHPLVLPSMVAGSSALFFAGAWLTGTPLSRLSAGGWLLGPFPPGSPWQFPLSPAVVSQVNWAVFLTQVPTMVPVLVVSVLALLLNTSGLELLINRDMDLDHELVVTGLSNIASGCVGGIVGYHAISLSGLNHTLSGGRRAPGLVAAFLLGVTVIMGAAALGNAPRLVVGALLIYLGLDLLIEWVYRSWFRFPRSDYVVLLLILVLIAIRGFLAGIAIGLVLTIILFVVNYSRISVVKHALSGLTYRSRVTRSHGHQEVLDTHGAQLFILELQGFIFFGTANTLFEQFRARVGRGDLPHLRFVALDFARVPGLDSTALLSFGKIRQLAREAGSALVLTGLHGSVREQFLAGGFAEQAGVHLFPDLDRGVDWCESQIIAAQQPGEADGQSLAEQLAALVPSPAEVSRLIGYMDRCDLAVGARLIEQGDDANVVFFVESGQVSAYRDAAGHKPVRLETMRGGRVVGELGFYLHITRTAAIIADEPTTVYALSLAQLDHIERTDPDAARLFHHISARLLADRVVHLIRTVDALQQ